MEKDYVAWHALKDRVHAFENTAYCKPREVWWVCMGHNVGFEEDGKGENFERPVLVIKVFSAGLFLGIPLTSKDRQGNYYFPLEYNNVKSTAILSQTRALSSKRLLNKVGVVPIDMFNSLKDQLVKNILA